jgi:transposase InsO family protein
VNFSRTVSITFQWTGQGWFYLAVILDLFGWAMRDHMRAELTIAALTMAIQRRRPGAGLIHQSDRGSQYAPGDYRVVLQAAVIIKSMSRKANCWDNAPMESFFGTLKKPNSSAARISRSRCRPARPVRLYRGLLQSSADPLCHRIHHPRSGRGDIHSWPGQMGSESADPPPANGVS